MCEWKMQASQVVEACLYETGVRGMSEYSEELALLAIVLHHPAVGRKEYRKNIRSAFIRGREPGSIFLIFVLPILISLVSNWIIKWLTGNSDYPRVKAQAFDILCESTPNWRDILTCTSS